MGVGRACVAVLLLHVWGAARARPSQGDAPPRLLDRAAIFSGCVERPLSLASPQELSGEWCGLQNPEETLPGPALVCNRLVFSSVGEQLQAILYSINDGRIEMTRNVTFSRIDNGSWLSRFGERTTNLFIGFAEDQQRLLMCGTTEVGGGAPQGVSSMALLRCLRPGESPAARASVVRCEMPADAD